MRHKTRLKPHVLLAHLPLNLCPRSKRRNRINNDDVYRTRPNKRFHNFQRLLARIGLRDQKIVNFYSDPLCVFGIERVFGVNKRRKPSPLLSLFYNMEGERRLSRRFRPEYLDYAAPRYAADSQGRVQSKRTGRNNVNVNSRRLS